MSTAGAWIEPEHRLVTPLMNLIHLLQERHVIRAPVVKGHTLVGMVARRDVVFAYVKARAIYWP